MLAAETRTQVRDISDLLMAKTKLKTPTSLEIPEFALLLTD